MKPFLLLILGIFMLNGCDDGGDSTSKALADLQTAEATWEALPASQQATYCFEEYYTFFSGSTERLVTLVENDTVTELHYDRTERYVDGEQVEPPQVVDTWIEHDSEVGSHSKPARTIEEIFSTCREIILDANQQLGKDSTASVEVDERGMLISCMRERANCQDDCSVGVSLRGVAGTDRSTLTFGEDACQALLEN
mgnify:CR=1 FL=1